MEKYEAVIGLEVHAELNTESKIYCSCRNKFGSEPNTQVCPVCLGLPGTLPVLNEKAVEYAVKMGHALNCKINARSRQDRKNYFYPDLPKAYQISQADIPLCGNGYLEIMTDSGEKRIGITRIHIEEDAGKLIHSEDGTGSLADYNRCGVPLIEIVTEPDLRSSSEAKAFLDMIKSILKCIGISDCRMQEGSIRCDVNVSVREKGSGVLTTRCEMKNVNSFSAAVRGIEYEIKRQIAILEEGGVIMQETRRWDDTKGESFVMRTKENAEDYRYFPEPDLGMIVLDEARINELKENLPELPNSKLKRYMKQEGMSYADAVIIACDEEKSALFDKCKAMGLCSSKSISNRIIGDISKYINDTGRQISETQLSAEGLVRLICETERGAISSSASKTVLLEMLENGGEPDEIVKRLGLAQNSDRESLKLLVEKVLKQNEKSVSDYLGGRSKAMGYLVGQCMKASKGSANPQLLQELIVTALEK